MNLVQKNNEIMPTVSALVDRAIHNHASQVALVYGNDTLTYQELGDQADQLRALLGTDHSDERIIAVSSTRSLAMVTGVLGILKAGKQYLPLDPTQPAERLRMIVEEAGVTNVLCPSEDEVALFQQIGLSPIMGGSDASPQPAARPHQQREGYVLYTSGSTGKPKGVNMGNDALVNLLQWQRIHSKAAEGSKTLQFAPLTFDVSFQEIFSTLITGGTLMLVDDDLRLNPLALLTHIEKNGINRLFLPYVALQMLADAADFSDVYPACIQEVVTAGEQLKITRQITRFFERIPGARLHNQYGPTETHVVTELVLDGPSHTWPSLPTIGKPISNVELFVLDGQRKLLPDGEVGELYIAGTCLADGYLNRTELTQQRFFEWMHPERGPIRIYQTGDLTKYLPTGEIEFLGRIDHQVKIRGHRVELGEIEATLTALETVKDAVVVAAGTDSDQRRLVAYLIAGTNVTLNTVDIQRELQRKLPNYMIPAAFITVEHFPKTTSGKVDRKALPTPVMVRPALDVLYKAPQTATEKQLAAIWIDLLRIDRVGIDDNFFELGGNSLLAQKMVVDAKKRHDWELPITKIYQHPKIAAIAGYLASDTTRPTLATKRTLKRIAKRDKIAIVGFAGRFPGADNVWALWESLKVGKEAVTFFTDSELDESIAESERKDPLYVKARGIVSNAEWFDEVLFGITPIMAKLMDPQQRIFMEICRDALESTGHLPGIYSGAIGVYAGSGANTYYLNNVLTNPGEVAKIGAFQTLTLNEKDYIASRTAYQLNLKGPAVSVFSACSTSALAIANAVDGLRNGQCDVALAGGVSVKSPIYSGHIYEEGAMFSKDGHCRPFDAEATGTVFSDGAGVVLLKRLADAKRDGNTIYALISGVGINNDGGEKGSFTAPSPEGQADAIAMAMADAGVQPEDIGYIETHGTATPLGDPIEIAGLQLAFGTAKKKQFCRIGSIKSNLGHLTHAAGVASVIKTAFALHHRLLPPSINYQQPNGNIDFANSPFLVNDKLTAWDGDAPRRAGVSSFGVGGTNVHIVLESHDEKKDEKTGEPAPSTLISWSARTEKAAQNYAETLANYITANPDVPLDKIAYTLHTTRQALPYKNYLAVSNRSELLEALSKNKWNRLHLTEVTSNLIFMFPGQGAQYVGMGKSLYRHYPVYRHHIDECAALLLHDLGSDIRQLIFAEQPAPEANEALRNTYYTQPALFVTAYALAKLWMSWGLRPAAFIGHSIGEFVAAHLSGIFSLADALKLIAARGRLVSALPKGSMLSIRQSATSIRAILPADLSIAAINAPNLCVVSGPDERVDRFSARLEAEGIKTSKLHTSHAFHSDMMAPMLPEFGRIVDETPKYIPQIPIVSSVTGAWLTEREALDTAYWVNHAQATVDFSSAVTLANDELNGVFLETGPGNVTATLARQHPTISTARVIGGLNRAGADADEHAAIHDALGKLWANGFTLPWEQIYPNHDQVVADLPTYAYDRKFHWLTPGAAARPNLPTADARQAAPDREPVIHTARENLAERVRNILEDASGIAIDAATNHTNFVELGLDSLLLTQIAQTIKKELGVPITFRQLNEDVNTLDALVSHLDGQVLPPAAPLAVQQATAHVEEGKRPAQADKLQDTLALLTKQVELLTKQVPLLPSGTPLPAPDTSLAPATADGEIEKVIRSIEPQQEIWLSCVLGGDAANCSFNQSFSLVLNGLLDLDALKYALNRLVERHEALRSSFSADGQSIFVHRPSPIVFRMEDLSALDSADRDVHIAEYHRTDAHTPFDLNTAPLLRTVLFRKSAQENVLTLTAHHIVCDGWSIGTLLEELGKLYSIRMGGSTDSLPEVTAMSSYHLQLEHMAATPGYKAVEGYWVNRFRGRVPQLELPLARPRPAERTYASQRDDYVLDQQLSSRIHQLGAAAGASLVTTLLAAFEAYIAGITGQRDIVIGLPVAGQAESGHDNLVGHCVNLLPLRSNPDSSDPFIEYLGKRKLELLDDYDHQQFTFGSLLKKLNIPRDLSRVPLVPVVLNVERRVDGRIAFDGLSHSVVSNPKCYENFEIFVNVSAETTGELVFEWNYNTQLFSRDSIKRMMDDYTAVLHAVTEQPSTRLGQIGVSTEPEPFINRLQTVAAEYSGRPAIVHGDNRIDFAGLERKSNQLAHLLLTEGRIAKGDIVGIAMDRSIEMIVTMLAVLKSGGAYIPLDPSYPTERINFMLGDSAAKLLLTQRRYAGMFQTDARELWIDEHWQTLDDYAADRPGGVSPDGGDLAYILYTSGSTGKPKGVMIEHHSLSNLLLSMRGKFGFSSEDTILAVTTISFDISCIDLYLPLICGGKIILVDTETARDDFQLLHALVENDVTFMQATPTTWRMLIAAGLGYRERLNIISTGEPLPKDLMETLLEKGAALWNCYGPTETTVWSSAKRIDPANPTNTIGRPIGNTRFYIFDEALRAVPDGEVGELYIAGAGVARGYLNRADLTTEKFVPDPMDPTATMYATGDLGRIRPDGEIECLGRKDNQVKVRGYRIELGEIEYHLGKQEDIGDVVVLAREDVPGDQRLVAYVVPAHESTLQRWGDEGQTTIPAEIVARWKTQLRQSLPEYMVPNDWVGLAKLPLTSNNKIDRKALPNPRPQTDAPAFAERGPSENEELVAGVWGEVLRVQPIAPAANFFDLGGHSLLAVQVMNRLEGLTGKRLPLTSLFKFPILTDFAALFDDRHAVDSAVPRPQIPVEDATAEATEPYTVIPTVEQQREIWLSCLLGGEDANLAYNQSKSIELVGTFYEKHFKAAIRHLTNTHEALRATVSNDGESLYIHSRLFPDIETHDLSTVEKGNRQVMFDKFVQGEMRRPFDLVSGPLFRVFIHRFEEETHYVTVVLHHIICDATSMNVILRDISRLYNAYQEGKSVDLHATKLSEYVNEQRAFSQSETYQKDQAYWLGQFRGELPVLNLPLDFSRPPVRTYRGDMARFLLESSHYDQLRQLASSSSFSIAGTVTALVELLLHHRTQQRDIILGIAVADQQLSGHPDMVGHCVNILPLRSTINPETPVIDHLMQRKTGILEAYDHPKLTFSELLKKLNAHRDQAHVPLVPVIVSMQLVDEADIQFSGMNHRVISNPRACHTFELSLNLIIDNANRSIDFYWAYNTQLFTKETVTRMMREFELLLESAADDPRIPIKQMLVHPHPFPRFANYSVDYPSDRTVIDQFIKQARRHPKQPAVVFEGKQLTYRKLDETTNQLANYLNANGISCGFFVPLCIQPSLEMLIGILGILKAGAAYVPIDPDLPADRIRYIVGQSKSTVTVTDHTTAKRMAIAAVTIPVCLDDSRSAVWKASTAPPTSPPKPADTAYVIYTSGSTGNPKGVCVAHRSLVDYLTGLQKHLPALDSCTNFSLGNTISTDLGNTVLYGALSNGGTLHVFSKDRFNDPHFVRRYFDTHGIDCLKIVPSHWKYLSEAGGGLFPKKLLIFGGEPLPSELIEDVANANTGCMVVNHYGPTETTIGKLLHIVDAARSYPVVVPIGKPFSNTSVFILNEYMSNCPIGVAGELYIGGDGVAEGYYEESEMTQRAFITNPFAGHPHAKLYKTGDVVRWLPDGNIEYIGRTDDQVKIRGNRIELSEIQNVVLSIDGVKNCAIVVDNDQNNEKRLVAYVVSNTGSFSKSEAMKRLSRQLPAYMIPNIWMTVDELPLNANGKIDKKRLPKADTTLRAEGGFVAPRTKFQILLAGIWQTSLKLDKVGIRDNFFELGGHSLTAVKMMLNIEKETGIRLPLATLFEYSTIEKLAVLLEQNQRNEIRWDALVPIKQEGSKVPIYLVHGAGLNVLVFQSFARYLDEDQPVYALQALGLNGQAELLCTIEEIAAKYVSEVLENDAMGPYMLAGYSLGGKIAYEMARQLLKMGKEVSMLSIFDTFVSDYADLPRSQQLQRKIIRQFKKLPFFAKTFVKYPRDFIAYQWGGVRYRLKQLLSSGYVVHDEFFSYDGEINRSYSAAYRNYKMKPMDIKVHLFRTKKRVYFLDDLTYLGWAKFAKKGVEVHEIEGDHKTFILPPQDKGFAAVFQKCLDSEGSLHTNGEYADASLAAAAV